jgi:hypothetical protein
MRTFFAASSVSVGPKFPVAPSLIFSQEEEAEVECLRVVGGWLSKALLWDCLSQSCTPIHFVHLAIMH